MRNHVPERRIVPITFTDSVLLYPEHDSTSIFGAASYAWRATSPNSCNYVNSTNLGNVVHMDASNTLGENPQCANAFARYNGFEVIKAKIQLVVKPTTYYSEDSTWNWVRSANCYLTLDETGSPWNIGTTVASINPESAIRSGRNVKGGRTHHSPQGTDKAIYLTGEYTPTRVFEVRNISRNEFGGATQAGWNNPPVHPLQEAFWNLLILPGNPYVTGSGGSSSTRGIPFPHRVDVKITYMCRMFDPVLTSSQEVDNAPIA